MQTDDELSDDELYRNIRFGLIAIPTLLFAIILLAWGGFAGGRIYDVWAQRKEGEAQYAKAHANRKIAILEAQAQMESSKALADAEIIRARGVAKANEIIGSSLKDNEAYLRYLWIQGLQTNQMQTVYIPTEAGLPILEANPNIRK